MNPFEKQLQSWTPRRPSPKIARRLFRASRPNGLPPDRAPLWSWLTPLAACALTLLIVVNSSNRPAMPLVSGTNGAFFAISMLDAGSSNLPVYSLSQRDENLEWNVWPHAAHHVQTLSHNESRSRLNVLNSIPTNR
ncbi:MAG TPA: hypothetical protein VFC44_21750 [Candidatus Saccharimonadales bacterium]|nr:hypothetical protein [Candidatus Saccharimonadales bacterium]